MTHLPIDAIRIGERHRKEFGDIAGFARGIADIGMMQPVGVTSDNRLVFGERRIRAAQSLGWTEVPVTVVDLDDILAGEYAENAERKDFTLSESVAIKRALEAKERDAARQRQREHGGTAPGRANTVENFSGVNGRAADKIARGLGRHRTTLAKAEAVVAAAESEPERFAKLVADMDKTGQVNGVYKRLQVDRQAECIRAEPPPLPGRGPYLVASIDPPWPYEIRAEDPSHRATHPYPQMSIAQICALDVGSLMAPDSIIWLWTTNHHLREAFSVLDAWGFVQKTVLTWAKDRMGFGHWLRGQTEHCLMAVRGKPVVTLTNETTLLRASVRANSQKPEEFYQMVEQLCPAPRYAELFARCERRGWDGHGDELAAAE